MAQQQQNRWRLTDIDVPFKCVLWWMMKLGAALLLVGGFIAVIVEGVIALPSFIVPKVEVGNPDIVRQCVARFERKFTEQSPQNQSTFAASIPQILVPSRNFDAPQTQNPIIQTSQPAPANVQMQALSLPTPAAIAKPEPPKGQEFSIFRDRPQQITTQWGTHRIWIHDNGIETIAFSIDNQQPVQIKKAHGSDLTGDNRVMIYRDDQLALFHVNSPRAPMDCCLIIAFPVARL